LIISEVILVDLTEFKDVGVDEIGIALISELHAESFHGSLGDPATLFAKHVHDSTTLIIPFVFIGCKIPNWQFAGELSPAFGVFPIALTHTAIAEADVRVSEHHADSSTSAVFTEVDK